MKTNSSYVHSNLIVLCMSVFLASISFGAAAPYLPIFLKEIGVEKNIEMWSGVLYATSYLTGAIIAPFWGMLSDKYGRKVMTIRASFSSAVIYTLISLASSVSQLFVLQLIVGALSGFVPATIALVATTMPEDKIGSGIAFIHTASSAGSVIGPLMGGLIATYMGIRNIYRIAAVILVVASIFIFIWVKEDKQKFVNKQGKTLEGNKRELYNNNVLIIFLTIIGVQISLVSLNPVLPLYITSITEGVSSNIIIGIVFSLRQIAMIFAAPLWGRKGEKTGYKIVLLIGLIGAAVLSVLLLASNSIISLSILLFGSGLFIAGLLPLANTILAKIVPAEHRGRVFGIGTSCNQIGIFIGPIIGGALGSFLGINMVFVFSSVILVLTAVAVKRMNFTQRGNHGEM